MKQQDMDIFLFILALACGVACVVQGNDADRRNVHVKNRSSARIAIHWIPHEQAEENLQLPTLTVAFLYPWERLVLETFLGDVFEWRQVPEQNSGRCQSSAGDASCYFGRFSVSDHEEQVDIYDGYHATAIPQTSSQSLQSCQDEAMDVLFTSRYELNEPHLSHDSAISTLHNLVACSQSVLTNSHFLSLSQEVHLDRYARKIHLANKFEMITCLNDALPTSPQWATHIWNYKNKAYNVQTLLSLDTAQIHLVSNFITDQECQALEQKAKPKLQQATIQESAGAGSRMASDVRKAKAARIPIPWYLEHSNNPLTEYSRRVFDYTQHALPYVVISEEGQEEPSFIHYTGRGYTDPQPDRYIPHCDGDCQGETYRLGQRVATLIAYCQTAQRGGATNFMYAGIHIQPQKGDALFFSYLGKDGKTMDEGFTKHSGCPVFVGEKKIVSQWIRLGVDLEDRPWWKFHPSHGK